MRGTDELARAQVVYNAFRAVKSISLRDTQTGALYTNVWRGHLSGWSNAVSVPYPGEFEVKATWKDRGGWHHFLPTVHLVSHAVSVVSASEEKATFVVIDGRVTFVNHWPCDLELEPPLYETVSWWRW